jgi:hypothetical protein
MDFRTMADASDAVKYFTRAARNLTEQGRIMAQSPALHQRLKQEGAEIDRHLMNEYLQIDRRIAELQDEREKLDGETIAAVENHDA